MTCIRARTSLNFDLIGPSTAELASLERLKNPHRLIMGKKDVSTFSRLFLIGSFSYLHHDYIHESLDESEIQPDSTSGYHGNR